MRAPLFHAFVCLIFIVSLFFSGLLVYLVAFSSSHREYLAEVMQNQPHLIKNAGIILMGSAAFLFSIFYFTNKKSDYQVSLDDSLEVTLKKKVISTFLDDFFSKEVKLDCSYRLSTSKDNVDIFLNLSKLPFEEHEAWLDHLEPKLTEALKRLGVSERVSLSILCERN